MTILSATVKASSLFIPDDWDALPAMMGGIFIHEINPELARQWIAALTKIAEETN